MFSLSLHSFFYRIQGLNRARTKLGRCHAVPTIFPCDNPFKDRRQLRGAQGHFPSFNSYTIIVDFVMAGKLCAKNQLNPDINAISYCNRLNMEVDLQSLFGSMSRDVHSKLQRFLNLRYWSTGGET